MADIDTSWTWNFTGPTTMSKAHSRAGLPKDVAWDLIGFDGNETGCLRTHPGFRQVTTFTLPGNGTFLGAQGVAVLTSATTYVYGLVWFEYVAGTSSVNVYGKFTANGSTWLNPNSGTNPNGLLTSFGGVAGPSGIEFDVQVLGRNLLIFVRGQTPKLLFLSVSGTWVATSVSAGPGEAPVSAVSGAAATDPGGSRAASGNKVDFYVYQGGSGGTSLSAGTYSFAVQYLNVDTGRKSALSNVTTITAGGSNNHFQFKVIRLTSDYNRALIYRTVNMGSRTGASVYGAGALHLDQVITLSSGSVVTAYNSSTDSQVVYQDVYVDKGKCDTYAPKGGVAGFMGNTLFVSRISDSTAFPGALPTGISGVTPESPPRGLGDMRWSNTAEMQPENFNPSNRWVPKTPANEIINMRQVGLYLMGFSSDRIYRIGRSGQFIRVEEGHIGYGLQARKGIESVGSMVYFVSGGGLKAISAEGQVEDVTALDNLLNVKWQGTRSNVQLSFDAYGQCLTVLRPSTAPTAADGHAAILWFGTNKVTELIDLPFTHTCAGYSLFADSTLQRRAWFIKKTASNVYGLYVVDHERSIQDDTDTLTAHNLCGGTYFSGGTGEACLYWVMDGTTTNRPAAIAPSAYGCAAYNVANGDRMTVDDLWSEWLLNPQDFQDQTWSIAPIVQRWVGGNVGMQIQPGEPEFKDFFRQKQISSCRSYYEVILNPEPDDGTHNLDTMPTTASWDGVVYRGTESTAYKTAKPLTHSGTIMLSFDYANNNVPGQIANAPFGKHGVLWSSLSPGWTCYMSGVDLRLLAFSAVGRILDSDRRYV